VDVGYKHKIGDAVVDISSGLELLDSGAVIYFPGDGSGGTGGGGAAGGAGAWW